MGDDGTATVTDPTTGISHTIPGTELVNQDFEPVKPTDKVTSHDTTSLHEVNNYEEQPSLPTQSTNDTSEVTTPVELTTEENHSTVKQNVSQTVLPNTGTAGNEGIFSAAASMLAGLGVLIPFGKRRKKEDEEA